VNNATLFTADRDTHAKIVAVALLASTAMCLVGSCVQTTPVGSGSLHRSMTASSRQAVDTQPIRILPTRI
jgi:hypothetical protein